jgi:hypothetical protein
MRTRRNYTLRFQPDGSFHVDDVLPGSYSVYLQASVPSGDPNRGFSQTTIGSLSKEIVVPEAGAGESDDPLDLGELEVRVRN